MSSATRSPTDTAIPNESRSPALDTQAATLFLALAFVYAAFILYASFSFGRSRPFSFTEGLARLSEGVSAVPRLRLHSLRDISTNVLLYIPLGVFFACRLASLRRLRRFSPWLLLGSALSIFIEFTQFFINRYPDPVDAISNTAGYVAGFSLTSWAVQKYRLEVSAVLGLEQTDTVRVQMLQVIRFLYAGIYLIVQLLPLDISVSMTGIYAKLAASSPRIIVDPLFHFHSDAIAWHKLLLQFLGIVPLGVLSGAIGRFRARPSWLGPLAFCLSFVFCVEAAKVFVVSATTDVLHLAMAFVAGVIGSFIGASRRLGLDEPENSAKPAILLCGSYAVALLLYMLSPYQFEPDLKHILAKMQQEINWIPFYLHFSVRNVNSAVDIVREALLYAPLGVFIALAGRTLWSRRQSVSTALSIGLLLGTFNELAQTVVAFRVADITDVLLASIGCAAGAGLGCALWDNRSGDRSGETK